MFNICHNKKYLNSNIRNECETFPPASFGIKLASEHLPRRIGGAWGGEIGERVGGGLGPTHNKKGHHYSFCFCT